MTENMRAGPLPKDIAHCRSCEAAVVFVRTAAGKLMPVNVNPTDARYRGPNAGELAYVHGAHQSHFATCPAAQKHRTREVKDGDA